VSAELDDTAQTLAASAEPVTEADEEPNGFVALGLAPELLAAVKDLGYLQPTPVQIKTIPLALAGHQYMAEASRFIDLMVSSQTGSGKTAAFLLPVLHTLLAQQAHALAEERAEHERNVAQAVARGEAPPKRAKRKNPLNPRHFSAPSPGALVVCPTRELAQQVAHDAIDLVKHCQGLRVAHIVGGMPYQMQIAKLQGANLVVATPGRLLDLQRAMQVKLDQVQFLVVDEADRMLDLGFAEDLEEINQLTANRKQTLMFSATFAPRIQQLALRVMREPQRITIDSPQEKHVNIKQVLFWADNAQHKRQLLDHWLRDAGIDQAIVFASTQIECDGLAGDLQQAGFDAVALHGALSQGLRNRRLMALRQGQVQILVATDVAARGIDVPTITHVFNYGLPMKSEDYTHRIGRTGRAGRDGLAVTFAEMRERRKIEDIESYTRQPLVAEVIPGLEPKQRLPERGRGGFGRGGFDGGRDRHFGPSRGASAGGPAARQGGFDSRPGFAGKKPSGPRVVGDSSSSFRSDRGADRFAPRDDRFAPRDDRFAPAAAARKPVFEHREAPAHAADNRFAADRRPPVARLGGEFRGGPRAPGGFGPSHERAGPPRAAYKRGPK
jgi:superfamily II DNA/RNA helicase